MKLFLASAFDKTAKLLDKELGGGLKGKKVLFIPNASDNQTGDKWWIRVDKEVFDRFGAEVREVDLRNISSEDFFQALKGSDIIHFCGGSVIYLTYLIRERGLEKMIVEAVRKNVLYTGTSAGSMIVANDLTINAFDPEEKDFVTKMKNKTGLGLVNFLIMPHANNAEFSEANSLMVSELPEIESSQALLFLYDNQAVWVENDTFRILSN